VLRGVSLTLEKGLVYTLRGCNGSGKTTLINIISGFLKPDRGYVDFKGCRVKHFLPYKVNRLGICRTFQDLRLATQLTVYENIHLALEKRMFAYTDKTQKKNIYEILEKVSLTDKKDDLAADLSYGQQKLLTIGCCIANNAELLLIDEPVAGIDADNRIKIVDLIKNFKREGKTILQIEHNLEYINETSDHTFLLDGGLHATEV
jgi:branched-chain amino acid transport system ATP-binding protein